MTTTTEIYELFKAALVDADINAVDGPAKKLPVDEDGHILQAAILWPLPRKNQYTRGVGTRSGGVDRVRVTCVGATVNDALAVADAVEAAVGGRALVPKGSPLRQTDTSGDPVPEPKADPVRVSLAVEYSTITKG